MARASARSAPAPRASSNFPTRYRRRRVRRFDHFGGVNERCDVARIRGDDLIIVIRERHHSGVDGVIQVASSQQDSGPTSEPFIERVSFNGLQCQRERRLTTCAPTPDLSDHATVGPGRHLWTISNSEAQPSEALPGDGEAPSSTSDSAKRSSSRYWVTGLRRCGA